MNSTETGEIIAATIRILVADDDARVRHGLRELFDAQSGWRVVGEAASVADVLELAETLKPDLIVLDLLLPDAPVGLAMLRYLSEERGCLVIAISVRGGLHDAALAAGAACFIEKSSDTDAFVGTVRDAIVRKDRLP